MDRMRTRVLNVINCARCGKTHEQIAFYPLTNPIKDNDGTEWEWFALCPTNKEPILLMDEKESPFADIPNPLENEFQWP